MNVGITFPPRLEGSPTLPASKSISARALILNAMTHDGGHIENLAECDDTAAMLQALQSRGNYINVGAAGTAMRFLTAFFATAEGRELTLDGSERMRHRPIGTLVDALRHLGADISYVNDEGYPPLLIKGRKLTSDGRALVVDASISSQYISALLMIAPSVAGGLTLALKGEPASRPYIEMTIGLMRHFGAVVACEGNEIRVPEGSYRAADIEVEADWSAASYWLALQALLPSSRITLRGLRADSLQGDRRITEQLAALTSRPTLLSLDFSDAPDIAQTMAVAACVAGQPFRFTGLHTLRIKETDRIAALQAELSKLGYTLRSDIDGALTWDGTRGAAQPYPVIDTYDDHRMAMSMAIAATRHPGIIISDAQVVSKSYPDFWKRLAKIGAEIRKL